MARIAERRVSVERLTYRDCTGVACFRWENPRGTTVIANEAISRLAAYEDTGLTPEEIRSVFNEDAVLKLAAQALGTTADRLREICEAERDGRLVVLDKKPLPLVAKPDSTDAYCPYCDEDVSGLWGVADYVPDICQCPECGEFIDVCAPTITREEAEAALKKKEEL